MFERLTSFVLRFTFFRTEGRGNVDVEHPHRENVKSIAERRFNNNETETQRDGLSSKKSTSPFKSSVTSRLEKIFRFFKRKSEEPKPPKVLDPVKGNDFQAESKPLGMANDGAQCFRLAANQALLAFPSFTRALFRSCQQIHGETEAEYFTRENIRQAFLKFYLLHKSGLEATHAERDFAETVAYSGFCNELMDVGAQHDAAEYLEVILRSVFNEIYEREIETSAVDSSGKNVKSTVKDPFSLLALPLSEDTFDLQELIDKELGSVVIDDPHNSWKPSAQASYTNYTRTPKITGEPKKILPIHLKRFGYDEFAGKAYKNDLPVEFPPDDRLDLSSAYGQPQGNVIYQLKSFVCHIGGESTDFGHYYSYVKKGDQWYCCNDSHVYPVSQEEIDRAKGSAYLIFFERLPMPSSKSQ